MTNLSGKKVAFLVATEGIEEVELTKPWAAVQEAGATPVLVSTEAGKVQAFNHLDPSDTFPVDAVVSGVAVEDYDALVLPGGVANPDALRLDHDAVAFTRGFFTAGKPVAAVCHAPWTLIEADVVKGRMVTSWPSLKTDLVNAGASWEDSEVVVCTHGPNTLVTSRNPDDLPAFCASLTEAFAGQVPSDGAGTSTSAREVSAA